MTRPRLLDRLVHRGPAQASTTRPHTLVGPDLPTPSAVRVDQPPLPRTEKGPGRHANRGVKA